jgi:tripartite-type tricarboxylate transporter receptor subunit TctC
MQKQMQKQMQMQMQMNNRPSIKGDNKIYRVQNPIRQELSLTVFFLLKAHIAYSVKKTAKAHPLTSIIFGKAGGSWWKPEYRIIVGGKTKKAVEDAAAVLQNNLNGGRKKKK